MKTTKTPHSPEWFAALDAFNPIQAAHTPKASSIRFTAQ